MCVCVTVIVVAEKGLNKFDKKDCSCLQSIRRSTGHKKSQTEPDCQRQQEKHMEGSGKKPKQLLRH